METMFRDEFKVDQSSVIAELRGIRCTDNKVTEYIDDFNKKSAKLPLKSAAV